MRVLGGSLDERLSDRTLSGALGVCKEGGTEGDELIAERRKTVLRKTFAPAALKESRDEYSLL